MTSPSCSVPPGAIPPLQTAQEIASKTDVVTAVHVWVVDGTDAHGVAVATEREHPQLAALEESADFGAAPGSCE